MNELADQLFSYLKGIWRYRWFAVLVAWIIAVGGWIAVHMMPDRYEASARVYVDTQSVLRPLLSGLAVQPNVNEIVRMMSRTLINRPNLEKVIRKAGMDTHANSDEDRARLVSELQSNVALYSDGRENIYTITYAGRDPQTAKRVVQSLLTLFVEDSRGDKRKDSDEARRFIDGQLKSYGEKLKAAEKAVMEFKRQNVGLMPGEGQSYYAQLRNAETELRQARSELREAGDSRDAIKQQLASYTEARRLQGETGDAGGLNPELDSRINTLEKKLDELLVTYTDQHPDVVALVRLIAQLKEQRTAEAKLKKPTPSGAVAMDLGHQQLLVALSSAEANVAAVRARVAERDRRYNELKAVANALPRVEAEYTQLTRDYQVIRDRYTKLLERRESAQISGDMEVNTSVIGFRVIDPPRVPLQPTSPNRPRLMSVVLLAGLGGGFGIAFLMSQLRPTFNDERRLKEVSGLPVLGTVVMTWTHAQKARRRRGLVAVLLSFASLLAAYAAIMALMLGMLRA
jgi:polysaccharide chain length determinant protein (PEP-CTERM system associated)